MYRLETKRIVWMLEDERWSEAIQNLTPPLHDHTPHFLLSHPEGPLCVKFFREGNNIPFIQNLCSPRAKKEYVTAKRFIALSLPTPAPIGYGIGRGFSCSARLWIDGTDFSTMMQKRELRERSLRQVALLMRRMAGAKVRHNALRASKILFGTTGPCFADLHKVRFKSMFSCADEISNLCSLLKGLYNCLSNAERSAFFDTYGRHGIQAVVEEELGRIAWCYVKHKKRRAFRTTSKLLAKEKVVYVKGKEMLAVGERISTIKEDKKTLVERHSDHLRKVYSHRRRLKRAWRNHVVLLYLDVSVAPQPYQMRKASKGQSGYIAMEDLAGGGEELDTFLDRSYTLLGYRDRIKLVKGFSCFLSALFRCGIKHRDMKACNIFFMHDGTFRLLDVEDICFGIMDRKSMLRMFLQLNMSIPRRVSIADRLRFFSIITRDFPYDRKELLRDVTSESLKRRIQYVGVRGTAFEKWEVEDD